MRVLIVYPKIYIYGGAEVLLVNLCNYLSRKGIKNALLTTQILPEFAKDLINTEIILKKPPKDKMSNFEFIFFLWKMVRKYISNYDLLNIHNYPAEFTAFLCKKPVIWMCNEPELYLQKFVLTEKKSKFRRARFLRLGKFIAKHYINAAVVADEYNAKRFKYIYKVTPHIINYGIEYDFFSTKPAGNIKQKLGLADRFIILQTGMITPFKNQLASLKTISRLKDKIPNITLVLAGYDNNDDYKLVLDNYIKEKKIEDYVMFTGHVNKDEIRNLYYACDVFLHPIKSQGGWLSPFEALSAEIPIVVSEEMTAANIINENNLGIVTKNFTEAIFKIYCEPQQYKISAQRAKQWVKEKLSWDNYSKNMLVIFKNCLEK